MTRTSTDFHKFEEPRETHALATTICIVQDVPLFGKPLSFLIQYIIQGLILTNLSSVQILE